MSIQLGILIVYVAMLLGVSWWSSRLLRKSSSKTVGYLLAGRDMPTPVIVVMLVGLAVGGASTVGVAESAYTNGISAGWYNAAWGLGGILAGLTVAKQLRRLEIRTIPEMIGRMFGGHARFLSVLTQALVILSITALQYVAGGAILTALMPEIFTFHQGMAASAAIFILISLIGGYWASGLTNIINVIMIYLGIIVALWQTLEGEGGMGVVMQHLTPDGPWLDPVAGLGLATVCAFVTVMCTQAMSNQVVSQISFAARDGKTARRGFILGGILILPAGFLCAIFGIVAAARFPGLESPAMALPLLVTQLTPLVGGIFLAALWAADVSTAVGLLMGCSTLVVEDIVKRVYTKPLSQSRELLLSRVTVLLVSVVAFGLALTVVGILKTITTALAVTTSFTLLMLAGLYAPRLCRKAAGVPVVAASLLLWIVWTFIPQWRVGPELIYMEWLVCSAVFLICAVVCKEPAGSLFDPTSETEAMRKEKNRKLERLTVVPNHQ